MKETSIAIVVSRFNKNITQNLLVSCEGRLEEAGVKQRDVFWVPGAFELPLAAQMLTAHKPYDAIICLGCVVRGETPHFDFVCAETARGIQNVSLRAGVCVIFGVITANTWEEALVRSGLANGPNQGEDSSPKKVLNKGTESADAALEMMHFTSQLREQSQI